MISIIKKFAPYVKEIHFNDESTRKCDSGVHANLALMHYLQNGKTWYQTHFNAILDETDSIALQQAEYTFNAIGLSWDDLNNNIISTQLPLPYAELKSMFENASSIKYFFHKLYETIGIASFCNFIAPWIELLMQKPRFPFSFRAAKFRIYTNSIKSLTFEWLSISEKRGGRQTRRSHRRRGAYF